MERPSPDGRRMAETEDTGSGRKPDQQVPGSKGSPMTEHPTDAQIERLAYLTACVRQGEGSSVRCESPGEYEVNLAREWVQRVLKAMEAAKPSTPIDDEGPDFCGYFDDKAPNEAVIELGSEGLERSTLMKEAHRMWVLAAATLERDVMLHGMTEDEERVMIGAVLNAFERVKASLPTPVIEEGLVEKVARALNTWKFAKSPMLNGYRICGVAHSGDSTSFPWKAFPTIDEASAELDKLNARAAIEAIRASNIS